MKQVIIVRSDIKIPKGKLAGQVAHASVNAAMKSFPSNIQEWNKGQHPKIVLKVVSYKELLLLIKKCIDKKLTYSVIIDAGHTVFPKPTLTCIGIGPHTNEQIDEICGDLKLL